MKVGDLVKEKYDNPALPRGKMGIVTAISTIMGIRRMDVLYTDGTSMKRLERYLEAINANR